MRTAIVQIKTEAETKEKCSRIFESLGMNFSDAVSIFLRQAILHRGLPFEVVLSSLNANTLAAAEEMRAQIASDEKGETDAATFFSSFEP